MSSCATWEVNFNDGATVQVRASSKRMAQAKASVEAHQLPDEIRSYYKVAGKARNGKRPFNPNRSKKRWEREGYGRPAPRRSSWGRSSIFDDW